MKSGIKSVLRWVLPALVFLALAFDGNTHWDENNYLDKAAHAPFGLEQEWLHAWGGFYSGRIFHILLLKGYFSLAGTGLGPLLGAEFLMALAVLGSGALLAGSVRLLGENRRTAYLVFLCFIFSPLGLYLGWKSLAETTALLFASAAVFLWLLGLRSPGRPRPPILIGAALCLFAAGFCRAESLLAFGVFAFPAALTEPTGRGRALRDLGLVLAGWVALSAVFGFISGLWAYRFLFHRSEVFAHNIVQDLGDYPANWVSVLFFGGALWLPALVGVIPPRGRASRIALGGLLLSLAPLGAALEHLEIRYLHPALMPLALGAGLGLEKIRSAAAGRVSPRAASLAAAGILAAAVIGNQLLRPFQEVGVNGIPLARLVSEVRERYPDSLLVTSSVPNTYCFLRAAFPDLRAAGTPLPGMVMSRRISSLQDLRGERPPWIFISTKGKVSPSLAKRLFYGLIGRTFEPAAPDEEAQVRTLFGDSLARTPVARSGRYVAYLLREPGFRKPGNP